MTSGLSILLIDDNPNDRLLVIRELTQEFPEVRVSQIADANALSNALKAGGFELVITDYRLRWTDGLAVLHNVKERWPDCPVIMFTGTGTEEVAVEAMKSGLDDYIVKNPRHFVRLRSAVGKSVRQARVRGALRESEERYRRLIEAAPDIIFATSPDGLINELNPAFTRITGLPVAKYLGQPFLSLVHADDLAVVRDAFQQSLNGKTACSFEMRFFKQTGTTIFVEITITPRLLEGTIEGLLGIARDITTRKQADESLRVSQERLKLVFGTVAEGLLLISSEDRIIEFNSEALRILGIPADQLIENNTSDRIWKLVNENGDSIPAESLPVRVTFRTGKPMRDAVLGFHRPDGNLIWISVNTEPLFDSAGRVLMVIASFGDITDRMQIDNELRASRQRLELLSRQLITTQETEKRHLARELHDEIGQVLTAIKMNLRRTQRAADTELQTHLEENISMVDQAIGQVRSLSLNMRPPHLDDLGLVATLHWYLKHQATIAGFQEHISVVPAEIQVPQDLAIVCFRITQEAVTNAVRHAMPRQIGIELRQLDQELHLTICDDGIGFDVSAARRRASNGASLGLISMQERARLADGRIEIASTPGQGTSIQVWFPLSRSP